MANRIGIIGGGASGALMVLQLLRNSERDLEIHVFEPSGEFGRGKAYEKNPELFLLNTPAQKMSVYEEDPAHFLRWIQNGRKDLLLSENFPYVPRTVYGDYLQEELQKYSHGFHLVRKAVTAMRRDSGEALVVECGEYQYRFDYCCVATGFGRPENILDPKEILSLCGEYPDEMNILGTGLSAIDQWMLLRSLDYKGKIRFYSTSGAFPWAHAEKPSALPDFRFAVGMRAIDILRLFRKELKDPRYSIQELADGFRVVARDIWWMWNPQERKRFLNHLRSSWQKIRHRVPPRIHNSLMKELNNGRISLQKVNKDFRMKIDKRFLKATGFPMDCRPFHFDSELIRLSKFGLGFESLHEKVEILGPPRAGKDLEGGSIPEIRGTACVIAKKWLSLMKKKPSPIREMARKSDSELAIGSQYS